MTITLSQFKKMKLEHRVKLFDELDTAQRERILRAVLPMIEIVTRGDLIKRRGEKPAFPADWFELPRILRHCFMDAVVPRNFEDLCLEQKEEVERRLELLCAAFAEAVR